MVLPSPTFIVNHSDTTTRPSYCLDLWSRPHPGILCLTLVLVKRFLDITVRSLGDNLGMLACELIDLRLVELSGADFVLKEDIELAISTIFSFWKPEICPGAKEKAGTRPEEA